MDELDALRAEAAALGVKVDGRWGVDRLKAEVSAAQRSARMVRGAPDVVGPVVPLEATLGDLEDDEPPYMRAGGHINRGDGLGWVVEE